MDQRINCHHCRKDFIYSPEILTGGTRQVSPNDDLGKTKGIFSDKKEKKINVLLTCPNSECNKEDYYKVTKIE